MTDKQMENHPQYNKLQAKWKTDKAIREEFSDDFGAYFWYSVDVDGVEVKALRGPVLKETVKC